MNWQSARNFKFRNCGSWRHSNMRTHHPKDNVTNRYTFKKIKIKNCSNTVSRVATPFEIPFFFFLCFRIHQSVPNKIRKSESGLEEKKKEKKSGRRRQFKKNGNTSRYVTFFFFPPPPQTWTPFKGQVGNVSPNPTAQFSLYIYIFFRVVKLMVIGHALLLLLPNPQVHTHKVASPFFSFFPFLS